MSASWYNHGRMLALRCFVEVKGIVRGGQVVLDAPIQAPDGTQVRVEITGSGEGPGEWVKDFAGCVEDMPEDASLNYHQTLYGAKKR
jgi:hypothetical protein